jgi:RNA polymerase sigma-70 factor, ECF subfamily
MERRRSRSALLLGETGSFDRVLFMTEDVTKILADACEGDAAAAERLLPLVYEELRAIAARHLRQERAGHTLQPTALVHEAYMRLIDQNSVRWNGRSHFLAVAAMAMRRVLVNHARDRRRLKRGGPEMKRVPLDDAVGVLEERAGDLEALDAALTRLAAMDPQQARIVELRFFGGLTAPETAEAMGISERTVHREWSLARAWLRGEVTRGE